MPLQIRRGTEAERQAMTVPLAEGELLFVTNDQRIYIGTGTTLGGIPVVGYNDEAAQDATAALFANGTHGNINFVYDSNDSSISATVDLSNYDDIIDAEGIRAPILGLDDFVLFDNSNNQLVLNGVVASNIVPNETNDYDIGSELVKFKDLYLSNSLNIGSAQVTAVGSSINLPAGSTINGSPLGTGGGDGVIEGDSYRINISSIDGSTIIVNSENNSISVSNINLENLAELSVDDIGLVINSPRLIFEATDSTDRGLVVRGEVTSTLLVSPKLNVETHRLDSSNDRIPVEDGDDLALFGASGFNGDDYAVSAGMLIRVNNSSVINENTQSISADVIIGNVSQVIFNSGNFLTVNPTGVTSAPVFKPNAFANTAARDLAIPVPEAGMMIFVTDGDGLGNPQFQGWTGSAWVSLN